jgi:hypothetical protein
MGLARPAPKATIGDSSDPPTGIRGPILYAIAAAVGKSWR